MLWQLAHKLIRRGITSDSQFRQCYIDEESIDHLFLKCTYAQAIQRGTHISHVDLLNPNSDFRLSESLDVDEKTTSMDSVENMEKQEPSRLSKTE